MPSTALSRCVGDVDRFAAEHWGIQPMLRRGDRGFTDLFDVAGVEQLLVDLGRLPEFRLLRDGRPVPPSDYTAVRRVGGRLTEGVADIDRILDLVAHGASVVMQSLQRSWPPLAAFCNELEQVISHRVQANGYLSPAGAAALGRHADRHDVIVMQVEGSKRWDVEGLGPIALQPGDVMYLPAGTPHSATTGEAMSLHLTIGILTVTYRDVMRRLIDSVDDLDRPLPLGYAGGDTAIPASGLADELGRTRDRVVAHLTDRDPFELVIAVRQRQRRLQAGRRRLLGRLAPTIGAASLTPEVVVRRRARGAISARREGTGIVVQLGDRWLRMPLSTEPAITHLAEHRAFRIGDLPGLDDDDRAVLVRRLIREGLLEMAPTDD